MNSTTNTSSRQAGFVFWFAYHAPVWETKAGSIYRETDFSRSLHQVRDGAAFCELLPVLLNKYRWGGTLLNLPASAFPRGPEPEPVKNEFCDADMLVCVTRPPLSDPDEDQLQKIDRSGTDLEKALLSVVKDHFLKVCSRTEVKLVREIESASVGSPAESRIHLKFRPKRSACYDRNWPIVGLKKAAYDRTAGYVFYVPHFLFKGAHPSLFVAFGLAGVETLFLSLALAGRFRHTLSDLCGFW